MTESSMLTQVEGERPADGLAPGAGKDGMPKMLTPDEAAKMVGERDADEEAFNELLTPDGEVPVDLQSMSLEELDDLIEGLDAGAAKE